jgi:hypothetical protein
MSQLKAVEDEDRSRLGAPSSPISVAAFPPDVVRLLEVFARIEARRQARLRELREKEAS